MKKNASLLIVSMLILFSVGVQAQSPIEKQAKNVAYGSAGNFGLYFTALGNYERLLVKKDDRFLSTYYLHAGYGGFAAWGGEGRSTVLSVQWFGNRKNSHIELGLGIATNYDKLSYDLEVENQTYYASAPSKGDFRTVLPAVTFGYRYQKPSGGFVFRTGIASPDGIYLSLGYAF